MVIPWDRVGWATLALFITILVVVTLFQLFREVNCLRGFVSRHNHVFQLILSIIFFVGILISVYEGFGISMVSSLLSGVGIALGLALQPIMKKMVAGVVFDTTICTGKRIRCGEYVGKVRAVGMVHTWVKLDDGSGEACIHNDYFNTHPITVLNSECTATTSGANETAGDLKPLKYW